MNLAIEMLYHIRSALAAKSLIRFDLLQDVILNIGNVEVIGDVA